MTKITSFSFVFREIKNTRIQNTDSARVSCVCDLLELSEALIGHTIGQNCYNCNGFVSVRLNALIPMQYYVVVFVVFVVLIILTQSRKLNTQNSCIEIGILINIDHSMLNLTQPHGLTSLQCTSLAEWRRCRYVFTCFKFPTIYYLYFG